MERAIVTRSDDEKVEVRPTTSRPYKTPVPTKFGPGDVDTKAVEGDEDEVENKAVSSASTKKKAKRK